MPDRWSAAICFQPTSYYFTLDKQKSVLGSQDWLSMSEPSQTSQDSIWCYHLLGELIWADNNIFFHKTENLNTKHIQIRYGYTSPSNIAITTATPTKKIQSKNTNPNKKVASKQ